MWRSLLLVVLVVSPVALGNCPLEPHAGVTNSLQTPGDGGYRIQVTGDPERYVPDSIYTLSLMAPSGKSFRRFIITVEPDQPAQGERRWAGSFQLFGDAGTQFSDSCINAVSEGDNPEPQEEVSVMWRSPQLGSRCVVFRAMVLEDSQSWYADQGGLRHKLCELGSAQTNDAGEQVKSKDCCACDEAKYQFIFQGIWSNVTHPKDFPFSLWLTHFSDLIGASHERDFSFWGEGQISTDGFRQLAEWGSVGWMERELRAQSKHLRTLIKARGLWYPRVNENTTGSFRVDKRRHLVSLASMLGPSPDWVVGISGLDLCMSDCSWLERKTIDLYPYDAGTDSGVTYMSPNAPTIPREKMYRITTMYPEDPRAPFYDPLGRPMQPLARLFITREAVVPKPCGEEGQVGVRINEEAPFEDTETAEDGEKPECRVDDWSPWSPCSVSCGKGLRMRQRNYQMAAKAEMLGCDRQLIQKEMCVAHEPSCPGDPVELDSNEVLPEITDKACEVTDWGPWSECSSSCGLGTEIRTRRFKDRMGIKKCPFVELSERRKCEGPKCVLSENRNPLCRVTEWNDWSPCSVSCGTGFKIRSRQLLVPDEQLRSSCARYMELTERRTCTIKESCALTNAEAEEVCLQKEEPGPCRAYFERWYFDSNARECRPFGYGGCRGNKNNFRSSRECNVACAGVRDKLALGEVILRRHSAPIPPPIGIAPVAVSPNGPPVDCVVSEWSQWSQCSETCGIGFKTRQRAILLEPLRGGRPCPITLTGKKRCQVGTCDPFQQLQEEDRQ